MKFIVYILLFLSFLLILPNVHADTWTFLDNRLNVVYIDTNTGVPAGNDILIDKVSSSVGVSAIDTVPLIKYNLGTKAYSGYSNLQGGLFFPNAYNNTVWTNPIYRLYPSGIESSYIASGYKKGGVTNVNTYWKSLSLELYVARNYTGTNPSTSATNFRVYKRDTVNNYWTLMTNFYAVTSGLLYGGQIYLADSNYGSMYNLLNIWSIDSFVPYYQPQHLNLTTNGWSHDTVSYNVFTYNDIMQPHKVWNMQKSTANADTHILSGTYVYLSTYPSGTAKILNSTGLTTTTQSKLTATWYNGNESRYLYAIDEGTSLDIYMNDGWNWTLTQPKPYNLQVVTDFSSCLFIKNYPNVHISAIDCKDNSECVFAGFYGNNITSQNTFPLLVKFDGSSCQEVNLTSISTNSTLESVIYEFNTDAYYVGGRKLFGKFVYSTLITPANATIYPVCMIGYVSNPKLLCVNPTFSGYTPYCSAENLVECAVSCSNYFNNTLNRYIGACNDTAYVENCSAVVNSCFIPYQTVCTDISHYSTCLQDVGYDTCYTYQNPTTCPANYICNVDSCVPITNETNVTIPNATGNVYSYNNFSVALLRNPQVTATDGTVISSNQTYFTGLTFSDTWWCIIPPVQLWCAVTGQDAFLYNYNNPSPNAIKVIGVVNNVNPMLQFELFNTVKPSYMGKVCDLNASLKFKEEFAYADTINNHGWISSCDYFSGFYDGNNGQVLILNGTYNNLSYGCIDSDIHYNFNLTDVITQNAEISFTVFPKIQSIGTNNSGSILISLASLSSEVVTAIEVEFLTSGITNEPVSTCIYEYDSLNVTRELLWCYTGVVAPIVVQEYINWADKSYSITTTQQYVPSTLIKSFAIPFYYSLSGNIGSVRITPYVNDVAFGVDNILVNTINSPQTLNGINLDIYGSNNVLFNCQYQDVGTYVARFYNSLYPNVLNNFENFGTEKVYDFSNGVIPQASDGDFTDRFAGQPALNDTASFFDSLFGGDTSSSPTSRFFYAFMFIVISAIFIVVALGYSNMQFDVGIPAGFIVGLTAIVIVGEVIMFSFLGYLPTWIIVLFIIISAGIIALVGKSLLT